MRLDRRQALAGLGGALGTAGAGQALATPTAAPEFRHGVASGDPHADSVVLWTRLTRPSSQFLMAYPVRWDIAEDAEFTRVVARGEAMADPERDYTVKVIAEGLNPGTDYFYRFWAEAGEAVAVSPLGRTKTLPAPGSTEPVVLVAASCALHPNGLFNAYDAIARLDRVDAVVHLGDYIYEYGAAPDDYGMGNGLRLGRIPEPAHEIVSLADYRTRHAQYKADPDLQAAHARAPFIVVYDDHEVTNDPWTDGAQNHQPETEGDWAQRKAVALRAWYEWMPIREPGPGQDLSRAIQRSFRFGDVASLHMVESRLVARDKQLEYADILNPDGSLNPEPLNDPSRELLGAEQLDWLRRAFAAPTRWQVLGNQVIMARGVVPNLREALGSLTLTAARLSIGAEARRRLDQMVALGDARAPLNLDSWGGYPAERERLYGLAREAGARLCVLSGDSHAAWANTLNDDAGRQVGVEFGATGIASPSPAYSGALPAERVAEILTAENPEIAWCNFAERGFVRVTFTAEEVQAEMIGVSTLDTRPYEVVNQARFRAPALATGVGPLERLA